MYRIIYMQFADVWLDVASVLYVWVAAPISTTCWSFDTSRGKIEGNCDPELFSNFSEPLHMNAISSWLSDSPPHVVTELFSDRVPCWHHTRVTGGPLCGWQSCGEANIGHILSGNHQCFKSCGGQLLSESADKYQMIPILLGWRGHYWACYYCGVHAVVSGLCFHCV